MHRNRFFLKKKPDLARLADLFDYLVAEGDGTRQTFFRARLQAGERPLPANEMGAPPARISSHGRANPAGIPYLYLASDIVTSVAEVRPQIGEYASVAEFEVPSEPRVLDLREPKRTVSPFLLADEQQIALLRGDIEFLDLLGEEMSRPVLPGAAQIGYLPSQYLCEYAKHCGFDGVFYKSAVGAGFNFALFDPESANVKQSVSTYFVSCVSVELSEREVSSPKNADQ